jgi:YidC/Oxa1 family membrane protein insertase
MDKKNTIIGGVLLVVAFGLMFWQQKLVAEKAALEQTRQQIHTEVPVKEAPLATAVPEIADGVFQEPILPSGNEEIYTLENGSIRVRFSTMGGGIKDIAFLDFPLTQGGAEPVVFNQGNVVPALSFQLSSDGHNFKDYIPEFSLIEQSSNKIVFKHRTPEGLDVLRGYAIAENNGVQDPYALAHETRLINGSNQTIDLGQMYMTLGIMPAVQGDPSGEFLNCGYYNGKDAEFISVSDFKARSGFLGFGQRSARKDFNEEVAPLVWASIKNQFFTSVLTPQKPAQGVFAKPVVLKSGDVSEEYIAASMRFDLGLVAPGEETQMNLSYYVGPKEYVRLEKLGSEQDLVMQFGLFGSVSKVLLTLMHTIHKVVPNYGWTIILVTLFVKILLWPLTAASTRSSRRMAKIQEPLKALREKHKDNPQKIQTETMKLFKEYRVNPAMGCLPIIIQIPIFLGLFWMLRSAAELRFAQFLWIPDLSMPDTVAIIYGFPLNILPLIMGLSMVLQMKLSPMPSTDVMQQKIFQLMPFIFLAISYSFPSGLVLYWTVQNFITIIQQAITRRGDDTPVKAIEVKTAPRNRSGKGTFGKNKPLASRAKN